MIDDRTAILATAADWADRLAELTPAERVTLATWLAAADAHAAAFDAMRRLLGDTALVEAAEPARRPRHTFASAPSRPPARRRWLHDHRAARRWATGITAAAALAVVLPIGWRYATPPAPPALHQVYASATGTRRTVRLPDGSTMMLDAASRVTIAFAGDARGLALARGAARFEVWHDAARPFTVATPDARMTVLGTNFAVDRAGDGSELRVYRGRVRLAVAGAAPVVVTGGGWASIRAGRIRLGHFDPATYRGWQDDWLEGDAMRLDAALARLSRYSPQPIRLADPRLAAEPVAGRFRLDTPRDSATQIGALFDLSLRERHGLLWLERSRER